MTLEQYLELENRSDTHHEYFAGEIFEIEAATWTAVTPASASRTAPSGKVSLIIGSSGSLLPTHAGKRFQSVRCLAKAWAGGQGWRIYHLLTIKSGLDGSAVAGGFRRL